MSRKKGGDKYENNANDKMIYLHKRQYSELKLTAAVQRNGRLLSNRQTVRNLRYLKKTILRLV